jgi:hypothetical protein
VRLAAVAEEHKPLGSPAAAGGVLVGVALVEQVVYDHCLLALEAF